MIKLGVLISGSGTNLQAILDAISAGDLDAEVCVVVSNKPNARGLDRARERDIPTVIVDHRGHATRERFDAAIVAALRSHNVDVVVLAGFMRIVTRELLSAYPMRVVNIHPGLLPSFPGVDAQAQALRYGVRIAGCTVHFVDTGTDTGPIIAQSVVAVLDEDDRESLAARLLVEEHKLLPRALQWIAEGRVEIAPSAGGSERPRVRVRGAKTAFFPLK